MRRMNLLIVLLLVAACNPFEVISDTADVDRCTELDAETVDEVYERLIEDSDITSEMIMNFRTSPTYLANPEAWDWSFCLTRFGWECTGGTGAGSLAPTPPTVCSSPEGDDASQVVADNPYLR